MPSDSQEIARDSGSLDELVKDGKIEQSTRQNI